MTLHPEAQAFADLLREIEQLVRKNDTPGWADAIAMAAAEVEQSDAHGVRRFLGTLGGTGSLNDLILMRDGKVLSEENDRLHDLIAQASELGRKLWREAEERQSAPAAPARATPQPPAPDMAEKPVAPASAYILIGIAIPLSLAALLIADLVFLPRRGAPPLIAFRPDLPVAIVCEVIGALAVTFWITAWMMLVRPRKVRG